MIGKRAHKGQQSPSNPKERKGLKEAQSTAQVHSVAHPSPLKPAEQSPPHSRSPYRGPRQLPAPPLRSRVTSLPSGKRTNSASLEGNEPTLGKADQLRLARGHPSTERTNSHPPTRPSYVGIKCQQLRCSTRVRRRQAATPHSNSTRSLVRQLRSLLPGAVATL